MKSNKLRSFGFLDSFKDSKNSLTGSRPLLVRKKSILNLLIKIFPPFFKSHGKQQYACQEYYSLVLIFCQYLLTKTTLLFSILQFPIIIIKFVGYCNTKNQGLFLPLILLNFKILFLSFSKYSSNYIIIVSFIPIIFS